jgi:hypothetical protein
MAELAPDPPGWLTALRFDIDAPGGGAAWIDAGLPPPNLIIINPRNLHAHLIYLLGGWVRTDDRNPDSAKVVRYANAIERAYEAALGGDPGYAGRFHHNPFSPQYATRVGRDEPYSLDELAGWVDLNVPFSKRAQTTDMFEESRNVELFNRLRQWAYVAVADWRIGSFEGWHAAVLDRAMQIATDVGMESPRGPLPINEVGHTAKSVAKWVWHHYTGDVSPLIRAEREAARRERERERQAAREPIRERSQMSRAEYTAQATERRQSAEQMRTAGSTLRSIGEVLRCSLGEVHRLLRTFVQGSPDASDFGGGGRGLDVEQTSVVPEPKTPIQSVVPEPKTPIQSVVPEPKTPIQSVVPEPKTPIQSVVPEPKTPIQSWRRIREIFSWIRGP